MSDILRPKNKLLLHICCAGCGVYISRLLAKDFVVTLFYYNPNIFPATEYVKRVAEAKKIAKQAEQEIAIGDYEHTDWLKAIAGHESDPEKGERCRLCYQYRLTKIFTVARDNDFDYCATTLSVSPHKDYKLISTLGQELAAEFGVKFYDQDFKKQDGFKKSSQLSRELNLYRQDYCGCEFSVRS